jgi:hypothetical protein
MAFRQARDIAEHDYPTMREVEADIREFVHRDVVTRLNGEPENDSQLAASNINAVLQRVTGTSVQEIDNLITELQALRDLLQSEAERVQREVIQYSSLTQAALQSTKTIAETLEQWRKTPDSRTLSFEATRQG